MTFLYFVIPADVQYLSGGYNPVSYTHLMGVEEIKALGEKFDPNLHAAVAHVEDENFGENEVVLDMMKGYKYKEKVIRHSMVKVAN